MSIENVTTKKCKKCGKTFPATPEHFNQNRNGLYGLHSQCKVCKNQRTHERLVTDQDHREQKRQNDRERIATEHGKSIRRIAQLRRRSKKLSAEGSHTIADIRLQYSAQKGRCWHCGVELNNVYHVDHLVPLDRGGSNWPNNLVCACEKCNCSKGAKLTQEWNGRLI